MLDRCALVTCCSWLKYSRVARLESERAVLPLVTLIWPAQNVQKATDRMWHIHDSSLCVPLHAIACAATSCTACLGCGAGSLASTNEYARAKGLCAGGGEAEAVAATA